MNSFKQITFLLFFYALLILIVSCESDKPNQPIENTIDTIAFGSGDAIEDTTGDAPIDTTTIPDNFRITIERTYKTVQGQARSIEISMENSALNNISMGGFDFLIRYDAGALSFQGAEAGQFLIDCGWEYFTYRLLIPYQYPHDSAWIREIRVISIAETGSNPNHPSCFSDSEIISNQLAVLNFLVTNDRTRECTFSPIEFFWDDCGDNTITNPSGEQLYISNHIYNSIDTNTIDFSDDLAEDLPFPTYFGANNTCNVAINEGRPDPFRYIDYVNGGVEFNCADSVDGRGDLNLNEIAYEIADAILFANYFIYGLEVFTINIDGQIAASEVNNDGKTLTVADIVYLINVINGTKLPFPKDPPDTSRIPISPTVTRVISDGTLHVDKEMGAMIIVIKGNATYELLAMDMTVLSNYDGINTHILVYSLEGNSFIEDFLKVKGEIVSIEFGSADGFSVLLGPN